MRIFNIDQLISHHYYKKFISDKSIVLDIGSNLGEFSKSISEKYNCTCYAVEPFPGHFERIQQNEKVKKFNYAISDNDDGVVLYLSQKNPMAHTILKDRPGCLEEIKVPSITLENFIKQIKINNIDILKIDIEGAEIKLFDSTPVKILKHIKQITIEFHDFVEKFNMLLHVERVIEFLKRHGFYYINFSKKHSDVLFLNQDYYSFWDYLLIKYFLKNIEKINRRLKRTNIFKYLITLKQS